MRPLSPLLLLVVACAAPDAHLKPVSGSALDPATKAGPRAPAGSTLEGDDPLTASSCKVPVLERACAEDSAPMSGHHHPPPVAAPPPDDRDPVCGMKVDPAKPGAVLELDGKRVLFCSTRCRDTFRAEHPTAKELP